MGLTAWQALDYGRTLLADGADWVTLSHDAREAVALAEEAARYDAVRLALLQALGREPRAVS